MNYRVRYIPTAEQWAIDHYAWLRTGDGHHHYDGPWLQVAQRPTELAARQYIADVQHRQHQLLRTSTSSPHPIRGSLCS